MKHVLFCTQEKRLADALGQTRPARYIVQHIPMPGSIRIGRSVADCVIVDMRLPNADAMMEEAAAAGCCRISIVENHMDRDACLSDGHFDSFQRRVLDVNVLASRVWQGMVDVQEEKANRQRIPVE